MFGVSEGLILNRNIQYKEVKSIMFGSFKNINFRDKIALSGVTVLGIGIALLIFTFASAFGFLTDSFQVISTQDLVQSFGDALGPLIGAAIRIMYLGVMGWIGSLITIRGVTIIANTPKAEVGAVQKPQAPPQKPMPQMAKAKPVKEAEPEVKTSEPELVVIPLEEMEQQQTPQSSQASP